MSTRRRTVLGIMGVLGLAVAIGLTIERSRLGGRRPARSGDASAEGFDAKTPLPLLTAALRDSDIRALTAVMQRVATGEGERPPAMGDVEAKGWIDALSALRTGYPKFGGHMRGSALTVATKVLDRFAVEPAPRGWMAALSPVHDLLVSGMGDPDPEVRVTALVEAGRLWVWIPGNTPEPAAETALAEWKGSLHGPVTRTLADPSGRVRAAAVACLGNLPIDDLAAPALPYLEDVARPGAVDVRRQVLISFAGRRSLLTEEAVLKRLYDPAPEIAAAAEAILKTRGLTKEQISLGKMIFNPKPELRASVIPLLRDRTDIDPVVWLLELSRDRDESVRASAVEALAGKLSPEVRRRLAEMARSDESSAVREAAGKIVPPPSEKTVALPPLPGTPSLNPKAN